MDAAIQKLSKLRSRKVQATVAVVDCQLQTDDVVVTDTDNTPGHGRKPKTVHAVTRFAHAGDLVAHTRPRTSRLQARPCLRQT